MEIQSGDRILYHGEPGQVEFVAKRGDPETDWYIQEFGGGCMILTPSFGASSGVTSHFRSPNRSIGAHAVVGCSKSFTTSWSSHWAYVDVDSSRFFMFG